MELQSFRMLPAPGSGAGTRGFEGLGGGRGRSSGAEAGGWGQALGAALQQMPRLQDLALRQNQIGVKGAQAGKGKFEGARGE